MAITILLVGLASATQTNKTSTAKDCNIIKDTAKCSTKISNKIVQKSTKKVTDNIRKRRFPIIQ